MWRGMGQAELDTLIASGQIERVLPDPDTAREDLAIEVPVRSSSFHLPACP